MDAPLQVNGIILG